MKAQFVCEICNKSYASMDQAIACEEACMSTDYLWLLRSLPRCVGHTHALENSGALVVTASRQQAERLTCDAVCLHDLVSRARPLPKGPIAFDLPAIEDMLRHKQAEISRLQSRIDYLEGRQC